MPILIREATPEDNQVLCELLCQVSVSSGSAFAVDRSPDFFALLRQRGSSRTFLAEGPGDRVAGVVTALWHSAKDGDAPVTIGEIADLRVLPDARGGRVVERLLRAAITTLEGVGVDRVTTLVGDENAPAARLVRPVHDWVLGASTRYASVHYPAWRLAPKSSDVRSLGADDAARVHDLHLGTSQGCRGRPHDSISWPCPRTRAWALDGASGGAGVVVSDLGDIRRFVVRQYARADQPLLWGARCLAALGLATPMPPAGGTLRLWATRAFNVPGASRQRVGKLVRTMLAEAAREGVHVVQVNLPDSSPLLPLLPRWPRSIFWSTLYELRDASEFTLSGKPAYADLALL